MKNTSVAYDFRSRFINGVYYIHRWSSKDTIKQNVSVFFPSQFQLYKPTFIYSWLLEKRNNMLNEQLRIMIFIMSIIMVCVLITLFTGFCSEYSISGNMIQQNRRKKCQNFKNNPCPQYYRSTEAYKCE